MREWHFGEFIIKRQNTSVRSVLTHASIGHATVDRAACQRRKNANHAHQTVVRRGQDTGQQNADNEADNLEKGEVTRSGSDKAPEGLTL